MAVDSLAIETSVTWEGQELAQLQEVIKARAQILKESAGNAVIAAAVNVLTSLRARTGQVGKKPQIVGWEIVRENTGLPAGWARPGKHNAKGRRVVRQGGRAVFDMDGRGYYNLCGAYHRGETVNLYHVTYTSPTGTKVFDRHVFAANDSQVKDWVEQRVQKRIVSYKGISKRALGLAAHMVSARQSAGKAIGNGAERLVNRMVRVNVQRDGIASGSCSVSVDDNLPRAVKALKNGQDSFREAVTAAKNKMRGYLERCAGARLLGSDDKLLLEKIKAEC